jgi:hypothetical protein
MRRQTSGLGDDSRYTCSPARGDLEFSMRYPLFAALLFLLGAQHLYAQTPDEWQYDYHDEYAAVRARLVDALKREDSLAMALLVEFPLRVNLENGKASASITVEDATTLRSRFDEIFPGWLRMAVIKSGPDDDVDNSQGIGIYNGSIWLQEFGAGSAGIAPRMRVHVVNVHRDGDARPDQRRFVCATAQLHIAIDYRFDGDKNPSTYRAWKKPHFPPLAADKTLQGQADIQGSGGCSHTLWRFSDGDTAITVSEPGCGQDPPPEGLKAQIAIQRGDDTATLQDCY